MYLMLSQTAPLCDTRIFTNLCKAHLAAFPEHAPKREWVVATEQICSLFPGN